MLGDHRSPGVQQGIGAATACIRPAVQSVGTHPDSRGHGLASTLVHHAARHAFDVLGATTLVMVADPEYSAIRIYRSPGFAGTETQVQLTRAPQATTS